MAATKLKTYRVRYRAANGRTYTLKTRGTSAAAVRRSLTRTATTGEKVLSVTLVRRRRTYTGILDSGFRLF